MTRRLYICAWHQPEPVVIDQTGAVVPGVDYKVLLATGQASHGICPQCKKAVLIQEIVPARKVSRNAGTYNRPLPPRSYRANVEL